MIKLNHSGTDYKIKNVYNHLILLLNICLLFNIVKDILPIDLHAYFLTI